MKSRTLLLLALCLFVGIAFSENLNDWMYVTPITIESSENVTDYTIKLNVSYQTGMKNDFSDLRFADEDGNILPYWFEEVSNGEYVIAWVKVNITAPNTTIRMYFGNDIAEYVGSPEDTFLLYDDWDDGDYDGWTVAFGSWSVSDGLLKEPDTSSGSSLICTSFSHDRGYRYHTKFRPPSPADGYQAMAFRVDKVVPSDFNSGNSYNLHFYTNGGNDYGPKLRITSTNDGTITELAVKQSDDAPSDKWYIVEGYTTDTELKVKRLDTGDNISVEDTNYTSFNYVCLWGASDATEFDYFFVTKYIEPEPNVTIHYDETKAVQIIILPYDRSNAHRLGENFTVTLYAPGMTDCQLYIYEFNGSVITTTPFTLIDSEEGILMTELSINDYTEAEEYFLAVAKCGDLYDVSLNTLLYIGAPPYIALVSRTAPCNFTVYDNGTATLIEGYEWELPEAGTTVCIGKYETNSTYVSWWVEGPSKYKGFTVNVNFTKEADIVQLIKDVREDVNSIGKYTYPLLAPIVLIFAFLIMARLLSNEHFKMLFIMFALISTIALLFGTYKISQEVASTTIAEYSKNMFVVYTLAITCVILLIVVLYLLGLTLKGVKWWQRKEL